MFNTDILNQIKDKLVANEQTIAVAESVTAGLMQAALASAEKAEGFFHGGITTYNIGQKARHLNINAIHALKYNCVSKKMAEDMAISACHHFNSDWGLGITGYATPVALSDYKQYAWFSIALGHKTKASKFIQTEKQGLDAQLFYVEQALIELLSLINQNFN